MTGVRHWGASQCRHFRCANSQQLQCAGDTDITELGGRDDPDLDGSGWRDSHDAMFRESWRVACPCLSRADSARDRDVTIPWPPRVEWVVGSRDPGISPRGAGGGVDSHWNRPGDVWSAEIRPGRDSTLNPGPARIQDILKYVYEQHPRK